MAFDHAWSELRTHDMDDTSTPVCPQCGAALMITAAEAVPAAAAVDPELFMALPYGTSSTARWVCREHGDIGRVVVAVIDEHVDFVPIPAGT